MEVLCDGSPADLKVVFDPGLFGFTLLCPSVSNEWNLPGFLLGFPFEKETEGKRRITGKVPHR